MSREVKPESEPTGYQINWAVQIGGVLHDVLRIPSDSPLYAVSQRLTPEQKDLVGSIMLATADKARELALGRLKDEVETAGKQIQWLRDQLDLQRGPRARLAEAEMLLADGESCQSHNDLLAWRTRCSVFVGSSEGRIVRRSR